MDYIVDNRINVCSIIQNLKLLKKIPVLVLDIEMPVLQGVHGSLTTKINKISVKLCELTCLNVKLCYNNIIKSREAQ